jgi:hypothetical protein
MRVNTFTAILSMSLAAIIAFFLSFYVSGINKWILGIGSFLTLGSALVGTVSLSFDYDRTTMLTRTISGVFFGLLLISQIFFVGVDRFLLPTYVLVTGGMAILFALVVYSISRSKH